MRTVPPAATLPPYLCPCARPPPPHPRIQRKLHASPILASTSTSLPFSPQNNVPLTVLRLTVLCMLSLTAGLLGYFAHKLLRDREILTFEVQYEASVVQLGDALRKGFAAKAKAAELAAFLFKFPPGGRKFHSDLQVREAPSLPACTPERGPSAVDPQSPCVNS